MTTHIGFLGTGLMGAPMAANLLKAGFTLTVWNRTGAKTKALADAGAKLADTPAGVAEGADTVIVMLENGPVVTEVLFDRGVADALAPGSLVIDMASIPPATARDHAERLKKKSIGHLDAPVSGGTRGARNICKRNDWDRLFAGYGLGFFHHCSLLIAAETSSCSCVMPSTKLVRSG